MTSALSISTAASPRLGGRGQEHAHHLGLGEDRQQRDDVGEALVKRRLVRVGRIEVALAQRVDQRVRRLVHDDVVREARVDRDAATAGEVAEDQPFLAGL